MYINKSIMETKLKKEYIKLLTIKKATMSKRNSRSLIIKVLLC